MTAEELLAQLKPPRFQRFYVSSGRPRWHAAPWTLKWIRRYPGQIDSDERVVDGATLAAVVAAALAWEDENDSIEPEHAG